MSKEKRGKIKIDALNLAVVLMAVSFFMGSFGNIADLGEKNDISAYAVKTYEGCGFFCRFNNLITGKVPGATSSTNDPWILVSIILIAIGVYIIFKTKSSSIERYIKKAKKWKESDNQIKKDLIKIGFKKSEIEEGFKNV